MPARNALPLWALGRLCAFSLPPSAPQGALQALHFTVIRFVVVATEVKKPMNNQVLQLALGGDPESSGVLPRCSRRDDDIPEVIFALPSVDVRSRFVAEGQDIRRVIYTAKPPVKLSDRAFPNEDNRGLGIAAAHLFKHATGQFGQARTVNLVFPLTVENSNHDLFEKRRRLPKEPVSEWVHLCSIFIPCSGRKPMSHFPLSP